MERAEQKDAPMIPPRTPEDETYRLQAVQALSIFDTAPEEDFDDIVAIWQEIVRRTDVPGGVRRQESPMVQSESRRRSL